MLLIGSGISTLGPQPVVQCRVVMETSVDVALLKEAHHGDGT